MKKHSFGSRLFLGLVLLVLYLPIVVVVIYSFNDNSARIPLALPAGRPAGTASCWRARAATARRWP